MLEMENERLKIAISKISISRMTEREHDVLIYMAEGMHRRVIAKMLDIVPETCDSFIRNIKRKCGGELKVVIDYVKKTTR